MMIWATGRDPLTIYTRFILSSYISAKRESRFALYSVVVVSRGSSESSSVSEHSFLLLLFSTTQGI